MFTNSQPTTALRNYVLLAAAVVITSMGVTDVFTNPGRVAQQDRLDGYM